MFTYKLGVFIDRAKNVCTSVYTYIKHTQVWDEKARNDPIVFFTLSQVIKADATGIYSQKCFLKYDFEVITEIPYSEVEENLRPGPPHEALKLMVKILD